MVSTLMKILAQTYWLFFKIHQTRRIKPHRMCREDTHGIPFTSVTPRISKWVSEWRQTVIIISLTSLRKGPATPFLETLWPYNLRKGNTQETR